MLLSAVFKSSIRRFFFLQRLHRSSSPSSASQGCEEEQGQEDPEHEKDSPAQPGDGDCCPQQVGEEQVQPVGGVAKQEHVAGARQVTKHLLSQGRSRIWISRHVLFLFHLGSIKALFPRHSSRSIVHWIKYFTTCATT